MGYVKERWELGPNPDISRYKDVRTRDGWYRKRIGYGKLNPVMEAYKDATNVTMPAAKRIMDKLEPWTRLLETARVQIAIGGKLKRTYMEKGKMTFENLNELELQPRRKLRDLLKPPCEVRVLKNEIVAKINVVQEKTGPEKNAYDSIFNLKKSIYTEFFFELIIVWGDPMKEGALRVDAAESKIYKRYAEYEEACILKADLPAKKVPWMGLIKVTCLEDGEMPRNPRHYGMKVMAVGE
jgi:hypothetical protein